MTKSLAIAGFAAILALAACSTPDTEHAGACATPTAESAEPVDDSQRAPAVPEAAKDSEPTNDGGVTTEKAEHEKNTFEFCAGYWNCFDFGQNWARPDDNSCQVGTMIRLYADGTAVHDNENVGAGTWTGDAYDLKLMFPALAAKGRPIVACTRVPTN